MDVQPCTLHEGLAVYRIGDGEPVLLMPAPHRFQRPGTPSGDALINGLRDLGHAVVTFDPPGSGRSTRPARLGMREMHDCADEALAACGTTGPVDAVGHSMAGLALLSYALDRPDRIARLVLVGTGTGGVYMTAPGALWRRGHPRFPLMALLGSLHLAVRRLATERLLNNLVRRESFVDRRLAVPDPVRPMDWLRPAAGRADWHRIARTLDYSPRLGEITCPVLVLCGRHDPQFPPSCSQELGAGIRTARVEWFERSGHFPFLEEPEAFWAAVGRFLSPVP